MAAPHEQASEVIVGGRNELGDPRSALWRVLIGRPVVVIDGHAGIGATRVAAADAKPVARNATRAADRTVAGTAGCRHVASTSSAAQFASEPFGIRPAPLQTKEFR